MNKTTVTQNFDANGHMIFPAQEPEWKQSEKNMLYGLYETAGRSLTDDYSSSNWALWQIHTLRQRVNDLGAYADELEAKLTNGNDNNNRPGRSSAPSEND